jgi:hypothetical protein
MPSFWESEDPEAYRGYYPKTDAVPRLAVAGMYVVDWRMDSLQSPQLCTFEITGPTPEAVSLTLGNSTANTLMPTEANMRLTELPQYVLVLEDSPRFILIKFKLGCLARAMALQTFYQC